MDKVELSPDNRRAKVIDLLGLYAGHSAVPVLGDGIVQHIGKVFRAGET